MKIYTRTGDEGNTGLFGGERVRKHHPRVEAYGAVDELNAHIGLAVQSLRIDQDQPSEVGQSLRQSLEGVQSRLFDVGADLASPPDTKAGAWLTRSQPAWIEALESEIDAMEAELPELTNFILPGGSSGASALHIARTVCRRAERRAVEASDAGEAITAEAVAYLNRLSDWLFVAARLANQDEGVTEQIWESESS